MNHYRFVCPIKEADVSIEHCEAVHSAVMQGKAEHAPDKLCAIAHLGWMCPFRNAAATSGPWSKPGSFPHWAEPREKPDQLPQAVVDRSLNRLMPYRSDYRRAGHWGDEVGCYDDHLKAVQERWRSGRKVQARNDAIATPAPRPGGRRSPAQKPEPPAVAADAMLGTQDAGELMARAIAKRMRDAQSDESRGVGSDTPKPETPPQRASERAGDAKKPLTLAERARLMREQKEKRT